MLGRLNVMTNVIHLRDHSLSTYAEFSEKLTFLNLSYAHVRVRIRGLEMLVFRKVLGTYLMDDPLTMVINIGNSSCSKVSS